jgi:hypothetical protein
LFFIVSFFVCLVIKQDLNGQHVINFIYTTLYIIFNNLYKFMFYFITARNANYNLLNSYLKNYNKRAAGVVNIAQSKTI